MFRENSTFGFPRVLPNFLRPLSQLLSCYKITPISVVITASVIVRLCCLEDRYQTGVKMTE